MRLQPPKKIWKGLTSKLQAKLRKLKASNSTLLSFLRRRRRRYPSTHLRRRKASFVRPLAALRTNRRRRRIQSKVDDPVYVYDLLKEHTLIKEMQQKREMGYVGEEKGAPSGVAAATEGTMTCGEGAEEKRRSGTPELSGVDERAEQFIAEFRREISLERERSLREYQEMLQRGVM